MPRNQAEIELLHVRGDRGMGRAESESMNEQEKQTIFLISATNVNFFFVKEVGTMEKKVHKGCLCIVVKEYKSSSLCLWVIASVSHQFLWSDTFAVDLLFFQKGTYKYFLHKHEICDRDRQVRVCLLPENSSPFHFFQVNSSCKTLKWLKQKSTSLFFYKTNKTWRKKILWA